MRIEECKYNSMVSCQVADKCEKCGWNPTCAEERKKTYREKLKQRNDDDKWLKIIYRR